MERILVFSDTHGDIDNAIRVFDSLIGITGVIHLGDCVKDAERIENYIYPVPLYNVAGNNDFYAMLPTAKLFLISGKKMFLTHGHQYIRFSDISALKEIAKEKNADIILFGHTHMPYFEKEDGIIYANPGSISRPRTTEKSYGVIEIENGVIGYSNIFI